jgi:hypothetical protein
LDECGVHLLALVQVVDSQYSVFDDEIIAIDSFSPISESRVFVSIVSVYLKTLVIPAQRDICHAGPTFRLGGRHDESVG